MRTLPPGGEDSEVDYVSYATLLETSACKENPHRGVR